MPFPGFERQPARHWWPWSCAVRAAPLPTMAVGNGCSCSPIDGASADLSIEFGSGPVWLESDPAIAEPDTYYVWIDGTAGRVLLNEQLIANGLAFEGDLPESARFGAWLEQTEHIARSSKAGIWQFCA